MRYKLNGKLLRIKEGEEVKPGEALIEILSEREYELQHADMIHQHVLARSLVNARYCKADLLRKSVVGTFVIPSKENVLEKKVSFGYYMDREKLIFVDDSGVVSEILSAIAEVQILEKTFVAHFFFEFIEYLIKDDIIFLQEYEEKLESMEEHLMDNNIQDFGKSILTCRKELLRIEAYYRQLMDIGEILAENRNALLNEEDCHLFHLFVDRISRLSDNVGQLSEYTVQIREMYQSQIDVRQNNVMQFLTVITTIFMPLTLIVGWYGMNFVGMPELRFKYGYLCMIGFSSIITLLQFIYFKRKKWFFT